MKRFGRSTVSEILEDFVVYRNLDCIDPQLPPLTEIKSLIGLSSSGVPRKTTQEYARVITYLLERAGHLRESQHPIERVVFVGDTRLNDGMAFQNICRAGKWTGMAFIAAEKDEPFQFEIDRGEANTICFANRWTALSEFQEFLSKQDFSIDERTAVLLDLDKTTLGARGRNDQVIDQVRLKAAFQTVSGLLGSDFDYQSFQKAYHRLNQPEYHPFTMDNQDYLVYICLILGGDLIDLDSLVAEINTGNLSGFNQFLDYVNEHAARLPAELSRIHEDVYSRVSQGDPTPFKEFRYQEYLTTAEHMGNMDDTTPVSELLSQEITITQEVRQAALNWRERGALLLGISDKPDEASLPSTELALQGYQAIHRIETDIVGA
jgi:hypothetical protein